MFDNRGVYLAVRKRWQLNKYMDTIAMSGEFFPCYGRTLKKRFQELLKASVFPPGNLIAELL